MKKRSTAALKSLKYLQLSVFMCVCERETKYIFYHRLLREKATQRNQQTAAREKDTTSKERKQIDQKRRRKKQAKERDKACLTNASSSFCIYTSFVYFFPISLLLSSHRSPSFPCSILRPLRKPTKYAFAPKVYLHSLLPSPLRQLILHP